MIEYDPHNWKSHLLDIEGSMVREIFGRVALCVIWSVVVVLFDRYLYRVEGPATAHTLVGIALGMLLVFRTNASYDRFWEGRRLWGSIINDSLNLGQASRGLMAQAPEERERLLNWTSAFCHALMHRLRGTSTSLGPAADRLPPEEVERARSGPNVPLAIAASMTETLVAARDRRAISDIVLNTLEGPILNLIQHLGGCERIRRTPLPFVYVVHLRRALILYCYSLPFALAKDYGWATVSVTLLVSYLFFGIEEIGVEIEDPFGADLNDLPLERFCATIATSLQAAPIGHAGPDDSVLRRPAPDESLKY